MVEFRTGTSDVLSAPIHKLLGALVDGAGNSLATRWTTLPGRLSVAILLSGGRDMGGTVPSPSEIILTSLNNNVETLLSNIVAGTIPTLRSYKITKKLPIAAIATLTHETGHALSLGDEYGGSHEISGDALTDVRRNEPNLQALQDVTDDGKTTGKITGTRSCGNSGRASAPPVSSSTRSRAPARTSTSLFAPVTRRSSSRTR